MKSDDYQTTIRREIGREIGHFQAAEYKSGKDQMKDQKCLHSNRQKCLHSNRRFLYTHRVYVPRLCIVDVEHDPFEHKVAVLSHMRPKATRASYLLARNPTNKPPSSSTQVYITAIPGCSQNFQKYRPIIDSSQSRTLPSAPQPPLAMTDPPTSHTRTRQHHPRSPLQRKPPHSTPTL